MRFHLTHYVCRLPSGRYICGSRSTDDVSKATRFRDIERASLAGEAVCVAMVAYKENAA